MTGPAQEVARLLVERTGMQVGRGLRQRLAACLEAGARASGQPPEGYVAALADDPGAFQRLLDCVTVPETAFFRHPDQFAALEQEVLPALEGPVTVWSAGCASGQEAYSLAMVLAASGRADWQVLATDISAAAVARARAGRYTPDELSGLPPAHRHWLRPARELWEVDPALRRRVRVQRAGVVDRFPTKPGRCQVVFCRNVLVYLERAGVEDFLDRLADWLAPGGVVFLGYAEAVLAPSDRLQVERLGDTHALRAVPRANPGQGAPETDPGRGVPETGRGRGVPRAGLGRLWTAGPSPSGGGLRSPTGGPGTGPGGSGAEPRGWRAPEEPTGALPATVAAMVAAGTAAAAAGDHRGAVAAFRKAVFLDPDQAAAWFQLGLALEAVEDRRGARRAYAAALATLGRCDPDAVKAGLGGWPAAELAGVLMDRLDQRGGRA